MALRTLSHAGNRAEAGLSALIGILILMLLTPAVGQAAASTVRVSVSSAEAQGNGHSSAPSTSANGRYVAFASRASNLVPGDTNRCSYASGATLPCTDVFVRDRVTGTTRRVSVSTGGSQGNFDSYQPSLSATGRYVAFTSGASNLVPGDTNTCFEGENCSDVFVRDRDTDGDGIFDEAGAVRTVRASISSSERQASGYSSNPSISADGRFVAFEFFRWNSDLVPGNPAIRGDILLRDRMYGTTTRVNRSTGGIQANGQSSNPAISSNGRYIAFESVASNLAPGGTSTCGNDRGDTYNCSHIYLRDRVTNTTTRVSLTNSGARAGDSYKGSYDPSISADGRYVAFASDGSNLVAGDTNSCFDTANCDDVFVRDRLAGRTERVSVSSSERQASGYSSAPSITADGRYVAFQYRYWASNLVPGNAATAGEVLLRDRVGGTTTRVSQSSAGAQANGASGSPSISGNGWHIAFDSVATNLVSGDTNNRRDVFLRSR